MKVIVIADLHGKSVWKTLNLSTYDKVIFLGDYLDSFDVAVKDQLANFQEVVQLKKVHPGKVVLLLGNHEVHYRYDMIGPYSGYRSDLHFLARPILEENADLFQLAHLEGKHLFTHAGVTGPWWEYFLGHPFINELASKHPIDEVLNQALAEDQLQLNRMLFSVGRERGNYGSQGKPLGGPVWADRKEMVRYPLEGFHHIVGHTSLYDVTSFPFGQHTSVTFTDCLDHTTKFHEIDL